VAPVALPPTAAAFWAGSCGAAGLSLLGTNSLARKSAGTSPGRRANGSRYSEPATQRA
jgi:hypothetical protein